MTTKTAPSVSIVIPVYNGEIFIERTLRSALAQTYPNLEILVVNDGSTDGTLAIIDRLIASHEKIQVVTIPNGGVDNARNVGTEWSQACYVAYLDADDLWHPTKVEKQVATLEQHGDDHSWAACYALFRRIDEVDLVIGDGFSQVIRGPFFPSHLATNFVGNGSSLLVRREAALAVNGFDPNYAARGIGGCEDWDFQLRILQHYKMDVVHEFMVGYRCYPGNMSSNDWSMANGKLAVISAFSADPRLSPSVRRVVRGRANRLAIENFVRARAWSDIARVTGASVLLDPMGTLKDALIYAPKMVFRVLKWLNRKIAPTKILYKRKKPPSEHFDTFEPKEGLKPVESLPKSALHRRLSRLDATFYSE